MSESARIPAVPAVLEMKWDGYRTGRGGRSGCHAPLVDDGGFWAGALTRAFWISIDALAEEARRLTRRVDEAAIGIMKIT